MAVAPLNVNQGATAKGAISCQGKLRLEKLQTQLPRALHVASHSGNRPPRLVRAEERMIGPCRTVMPVRAIRDRWKRKPSRAMPLSTRRTASATKANPRACQRRKADRELGKSASGGRCWSANAARRTAATLIPGHACQHHAHAAGVRDTGEHQAGANEAG
jgi:hypothetical protein